MSLRVKDLLDHLHRLAGSYDRVGTAIGISGRTLRTWMHKTAEELAELPRDTIEAIRRAAAEFNVPADLFEASAVLWDEHKSYVENLASPAPLPPVTGPLRDLRAQVLGLSLLSNFGVASSNITADANRVRFFFQTGAGAVTYKTIRSSGCPAYPGQNLLYCASNTAMLDIDRDPPYVIVGEPSDGYKPQYGSANRCGMPSRHPEELRADIVAANAAAARNQLFILSVVGSSPQNDAKEIIDDFRRAIRIGVECSVGAYELNFSYPIDETSSICDDVELASSICAAARDEVGDAKILIKLPYLTGDQLRALVLATERFVDGYTAINSVPVTAYRDGGRHGQIPAFGSGARAGLAGRPIFERGLRCARELVDLREHHQLTHLTIIGVGGASTPQDVRAYLDCGVDFVEAATIFLQDSLFALKVHHDLARQLESDERSRHNDLNLAWSNLGAAIDAAIVDGVDARRATEIGTMLHLELRDSYNSLGLSPRRARDVRSIEWFLKEIKYRARTFRPR